MSEPPITLRAPRAADLPPHEPGDSGWARCLTLMLDEIDYGVLLIDHHGFVRLVNHIARHELDASHPLKLVGGRLHADSRTDHAELLDALDAATLRNPRRLLLLGDGAQRVSASVVPLGAGVLEGGTATMLLLGRRRVCENLSVQCFARSRRLTPAEERVLQALCAGASPTTIAARQGLKISTIRTQIGGIREKTGARSIRALLRLVATLPPMVQALRAPFGLLLEDTMPPR